MTKQQHPITPPPELVQQWLGDFFGCTPDPELSDSERFLATRAAQWGADQELEACCELITKNEWFADPSYRLSQLLEGRRPKPPSLKQQAMEKLLELNALLQFNDVSTSVIRRALEALPDD
jgi:hypothetical protein